MPVARPLKMQQIWDEVRDVFPDAGFNKVARIINNEVIDLAVRLGKMRFRTHKIDLTSGVMFYDISDQATGLGINKLYRVDFLNSVDQYKKIPRAVSGKSITTYVE